MSLLGRGTGVALAIAAASMAGCAMYSTSDSSMASNEVHCYGVNKCAGHNDCKTSSNACKGHGSCKGHGFVSMPESSCDKVGGSVGS